jgi:NADPH-dependent 2,4-dienoyl-CoA reductase/sulfur reductase-like enzyme/nitrite reductase/ring-hydroxylating ferredoxin subunit
MADLTQGLSIDDIPHDGFVAGEVNGEAVLVSRVGDEIFAIGATCTHYSGPLGEGLRVGDTIRCPWHHACFDLRSGEALHAPALNPLPRYKVERENNRIIIREALPPATPPEGGRKPAEGPTVIIVGGGAAGHAAAEMLSRKNYKGRVVMVSADEAPPVDRPNLSKDYLAGNAPEEWIPLPQPDGVELMLNSTVTAIDAANKTIAINGKERLTYDQLLIATGSDPIHLPIPGADLPHVHTLRTFADSRAIIARATASKRAVVIGASFIGLEVAASLRARGLEVVVVSPEAIPLERIMGRAVGEFIRRLHEEHGVVFRLGHKPASIDKDKVQIDSGESFPADLVVMGVGVRPNVKLAQDAGLRVDNGIVVDEHLRTSDPNIFAAGDAARWPDRRSGESIRVEHWVVAQRQGQTAAHNLLGGREAFDAVPFFWSAHYDVTIAYSGYGAGWDSDHVSGDLDAHNATIAYRKNGRIVAVATIFRDDVSLRAEAAMERGDDAEVERLVS